MVSLVSFLDENARRDPDHLACVVGDDTLSYAELRDAPVAPRGFSLLPDALKPGFHCARTHWIRGFMAFWLARRTRTVRLTVPM